MHGLQINKNHVAKATAAYTTGELAPEATVPLKDKDGNEVKENGVTKTYSPKNELNKIVAKEYLGDETKGDVATELRIRYGFHVADSD